MGSVGPCDSSIQENGSALPVTAVANDTLQIMDQQHALEHEYLSVYDELHAKLRRILYLNRFVCAASEPRESILREAAIAELALGHLTTSHAAFLRDQSAIVVDKTLLNNFLQLVVPVLRAVHHNSDDLAASEQNINRILTQLYSIDISNGCPRGDAFRFMRALDRLIPSIDVAAKRVALARIDASRDVSSDEMTSRNELADNLKSLKKSEQLLRRELTANVAGLQVKKGDAIRELQLGEIRALLSSLTEQWALAGRTATFLQIWITTLPINWYDDEDLRHIIDECQDISESVDQFEEVLSSRTLDKFSDEQLMMLKFSNHDND